MSTVTIYPAILSGGVGTRLWPLARASTPKQLLALYGKNTLIQDTALRATFPNAAPPLVVCGERHRFIVAEQMQEVGISPAAIVLEPVGRNTAPAAAIISLMVAEKYPQGLILLLPSDHVIQDIAAFQTAVAKATTAARDGYIVAFGLKPSGAETGYGYIEVGPPLKNGEGANSISRFLEKPDAKAAAAYSQSGNYCWNSGMLLFRADVMLAELRSLAPDIVGPCTSALAAASRDSDFVRLDTPSFESAPNISIDVAIMEKTAKAAVVPCDLGWADVGTWSSLWSLEERDADDNVLQGDVVTVDAQGSFVRSDRGLTALVGVKDLVVVAIEDIVLVADRMHTQSVSAVVQKLKSLNRPEVSDHPRVQRPWGSYQSIDSGAGFQVKEIVVKPGGRLSLQMHHKRAEHWVVVEGTAQVTCDGKVFTLNTNEATFIPLGAKHRLENLGKTLLRLIEVQCGSYLGEDDIVRFEDVYGRADSRKA
ncbi:MAG: mannose-1-phosphate guanylyltransferase/mannose-6-phosphate isomerase [Proteobacteria bacterium]|nr:mannose-1-phosphate guanylyltransferase/mannose-6-phosphate isomerase [Pseudomonadota bacterium]